MQAGLTYVVQGLDCVNYYIESNMTGIIRMCYLSSSSSLSQTTDLLPLPLLVLFLCLLFLLLFSVFYLLCLSTRCCFSFSLFYPSSPPYCPHLSVSPLTFILSILASDIIYIGPVKGKPLPFFLPSSVLHFSALLPHLRPLTPPQAPFSSLSPFTVHCPSFLPPAAGALRSHDICNLWDSWPQVT